MHTQSKASALLKLAASEPDQEKALRIMNEAYHEALREKWDVRLAAPATTERHA